MKLKYFLTICCILCSILGLYGQQSYSSFTIPENLKNGVAVVRNYEVNFERPNINTASERRTLVVTVLNGKGTAAAELYISIQKNFSSLKSFSGEIFDRNGNSVRKIKNKDLKYTESSGNLASNAALYYYKPHHSLYPYTIKYEWEVNYKNGILAFPVFDPVPMLQCAVEKAVYRLTLPAGTVFHSRSFNMPALSAESQKNIVKEKDIYEWKLKNFPCIEYESFAPAAIERYPLIYFSPHEFSYDGVTGYMDSWKSYGQWQWKLLAERSILPDELKQKIDEITASATSPMEKIKVLYDYLAATTRYVSIQIGIGGFQPMTAAEVYKTGFGDCKALSNYMQAMLAHCGIKSYYTEIGAMNARRVLPDFANVYFTNHAILQVPVDNDTLWLECTNPNIPLGYTHTGIAGRYALVYRDSTVYPIMTNSYPDSLHLSEIKAEINLSADGSIKGQVSETRRMNRYVNAMDFGKKSNDERINNISSNLNIATPHISAVSYKEDKGISPVSTISYNIEALQLGSKTESRLFLDIMPLRKKYNLRLSKSARKFPIVIENGDIDKDEITINLPVGISIEVLPAPVVLNSKFGSYSLTVAFDKDTDGRIGNGTLKIKRSFLLRSGKYSVENYNDFKTFMDSVTKVNNSEIVLKFD